MTVKIGINGFGRIGRNFFRAAKERGMDFDFVAANDLLSIDLMAHLLKYDTVKGTYQGDVEVVGDGIKVDGDTLKILAERDPKALPWGELGVDVVVESSGLFTRSRQGRAAPRGRRARRGHLRPREGCRRHVRHGRERRDVRPRRSTR